MNPEDLAISRAVRAAFGETPPRRIGIAVSGGGDSTALLLSLARGFAGTGVALRAATVDHGLRPEAAAEARAAAGQAADLGISHDTLRWQGWDGAGNLQDQARRARYALLSGWARGQGIPTVALGHTSDDRAETVLMRLGRAAGVDGLAAMHRERWVDGVRFLRPMLSLTREDLRAYLRRNGLTWSEDPSNEDEGYARIRARKALTELENLGITTSALNAVADHMAEAREVLVEATRRAARDLAQVDAGDIVFDTGGLLALPRETRRRLLVAALMWIGGAHYPPRRAELSGLLDALSEGRKATLAGCLLVPGGGQCRLMREFAAVQELTGDPGQPWDRRWHLEGPAVEGGEIRALGAEGLAQCPGWRDTGRPRDTLLASPALWQGDRLVAAPLAGIGEGWQARCESDQEGVFGELLSH